MKKHLALLVALALAGCESPPPYTITAPPPNRPVGHPPPLGGTAGPLAAADVDRYMDGQEADLRARVKGKGVVIRRRGEDILIVLPADDLFAHAGLGGDGRDLLATLAGVLSHYDRTLIAVDGYTDTTGSADANLKVSARRADLVKTALVAGGVAPDRVTAKGLGETELRVPTGDNVAEPRNRRVEILVTAHPGG